MQGSLYQRRSAATKRVENFCPPARAKIIQKKPDDLGIEAPLVFMQSVN